MRIQESYQQDLLKDILEAEHGSNIIDFEKERIALIQDAFNRLNEKVAYIRVIQDFSEEQLYSYVRGVINRS